MIVTPFETSAQKKVIQSGEALVLRRLVCWKSDIDLNETDSSFGFGLEDVFQMDVHSNDLENVQKQVTRAAVTDAARLRDFSNQHGAKADVVLYVVNPKGREDIFDSIEFGQVPSDADVESSLKDLFTKGSSRLEEGSPDAESAKAFDGFMDGLKAQAAKVSSIFPAMKSREFGR